MPKVLYLCSSWPRGAGCGGQLRALHVGRALKHVGEVTVAVVSADAGDAEAQRQTRQEFGIEVPITPQVQPNRGTLAKLRWAFDPKYFNVHGFVAARADRERLIASLPKYDLVWVLNSRTPNILQLWDWPGAHLDMDDLPSSFLATEARHGSNRRQRWKARLVQPFSKRRERLFAQRFTTLSVCSDADRQYLGGGDRIHVIPNGFERPVQEPTRTPVDPPMIGFVGLYSFAPNLEGVRWFLNDVWPAIREAIPGVRFRLLGRDTDGPLRPTDPEVDAVGWVDDPAAEIATWSAMVIPIRLGAGTRVKIADAFSRKCPVVSTRLGAYGYEVEDGRELRLVNDNDAGAFASACVSLVRDREGAEAMAERAYKAFLEKWTWDAIAPRVWAAAEDCLRRGKAESRK